jgi:spore maturation protein CgeB
MKIVILGLSITSSWGNGHATTYRGLVREFGLRGHTIHFLERDVPWYARHRDFVPTTNVKVSLYRDVRELKQRFGREIRAADAVIVGSYVPDGVAIGRWVQSAAEGVTAFYDIDTPVTLAALRRGSADYLSPELIPRYDVYFSFTGGPTLSELEDEWGSPCARPLYCAVDAGVYFPEKLEKRWDLGYLGTYSPDRQPTLERFMFGSAKKIPDGRFVVAGAQYPRTVVWPPNVRFIEHLPPSEHRKFYNQQRFTLNVTRADMIAAGYSPSVRLFEAAACGVPIISDAWEGLDEFFKIGREILVAYSGAEVEEYLREYTAYEASAIGRAARARVLASHTAAHRAIELENHLVAAGAPGAVSPRVAVFTAQPLASPL